MTPSEIINQVNNQFSVNVLERKGPNNQRHADAVHTAALQLRNEGLTYQQIGLELNRDASSVYRGIKRIQRDS